MARETTSGWVRARTGDAWVESDSTLYRCGAVDAGGNSISASAGSPCTADRLHDFDPRDAPRLGPFRGVCLMTASEHRPRGNTVGCARRLALSGHSPSHQRAGPPVPAWHCLTRPAIACPAFAGWAATPIFPPESNRRFLPVLRVSVVLQCKSFHAAADVMTRANGSADPSAQLVVMPGSPGLCVAHADPIALAPLGASGMSVGVSPSLDTWAAA